MQRTTRSLFAAIPLLIAGTIYLSPHDVVAQAKTAQPAAVPPRGAGAQGAAGRNQGQAAAVPNNTSLNQLEHTPGANIPLGSPGSGNFNSVPWFLPFGGYGGYGYVGSGFGPYGYGFNTGYSGAPSTYGNYGAGSAGFGYDNLAGSGLYVNETIPAATGNIANGSTNIPEQQRQVLENAKTANSLYYQFRENNRAFRARQIARERGSPESAAKAALDNLPRSLGADELDQATGKIVWPAPLSNAEYAPMRTAIEEQFRVRSKNDSAESTRIIKQNVQDMVDLLRIQIEDMPAAEFLTARKFLDSLDYATHKAVPR